MPRIRYIKPGFFENDTLANVSPLGRLLFAGLWCHADREGRLEDRPDRLKAAILPYDRCDLDELLGSLARHGFIRRYRAGGHRLIQVENFSKHQRPHIKEPPSTYPAPNGYVPSTDLAPTQHLPDPPGMGNGEWGGEQGSAAALPSGSGEGEQAS